MKPNTTLVTIPALSDSATLAKFQTSGDPVVIVKMTAVGNNQPYTHRAGDKSFIFRWASELQGHILRVPLALWMQNKAKLAHELLDQRQSSRSLVVLFEMPAPSEIKLCEVSEPVDLRPGNVIFSPTSSEMGAADTTPAQNVVGLSDEPTAAPAVEQELRSTYLTEDEQDEADRRYRESLPPVKEEPVLNTKESPTTVHSTEEIICQQAYELCDTPKRIKALSALLGIPEAGLRDAIDLPASRVELAAAGWVRRKESQPA